MLSQGLPNEFRIRQRLRRPSQHSRRPRRRQFWNCCILRRRRVVEAIRREAFRNLRKTGSRLSGDHGHGGERPVAGVDRALPWGRHLSCGSACFLRRMQFAGVLHRRRKNPRPARAGRQDHAANDREDAERLHPRRARSQARRRLDRQCHRARHRLFTARGEGNLGDDPAARHEAAHGWRALCQRGRRSRLRSRRHHLEGRGRCHVLRRQQERRHAARGGGVLRR